MKNIAKKLVNVITPNPPTCINRIITVSPKGVKVADTSTGTRPVTHTALVEVNNASTHEIDIPSTVQRGSNNNPVPISIITRKLTARINEGFVLRPNSRTRPLDKLRKEKSNKRVT